MGDKCHGSKGKHAVSVVDETRGDVAQYGKVGQYAGAEHDGRVGEKVEQGALPRGREEQRMR